MARRKNLPTLPSRNLAKTPESDGLMNDAPVAYPVADTAITALQLYRNPLRRPTTNGPWDEEADKVAWVDAETDLGCIILRQEDGTLSGYVGVGPDHALFGFEAEAVPIDLANCVHGGITYGRPCEVNRFETRAHGKPREERYTVCHVTRVMKVQRYRTVQTTKDEFAHEDLWWLGFDTNHAGDLVPKPRGHKPRLGDVYRDQAFVYENVVELARRLKSVANRRSSGSDQDAPPQLSPPHTPEADEQ